MKFETFQTNCKYAKFGLKEDTVREFELTCRKPERIPKGHSWGICDEQHCPYFGMKCDSGVMMDANTGEVLLSVNNCRVVFGN